MKRAIRRAGVALAMTLGLAAAAVATALAVASLLAGPAHAAPGVAAAATTALEAPSGTPGAVIDLATPDGVALVRGAWRYSDTKISEVEFRSVGADLKPSGPPNRTYDFTPHAGAAGFDDSAWPVIDPTTLQARRSTGKVCFSWYRLQLTVPDRIGAFDPTGSTVVLEVVVDDYAEIWVDGRLERHLGQRGGNLVAGWNAPNRVVIGSGVRPGQKIQLAVFGINGPISIPAENYIWIRSAKVEFHRPLVEPLAFAGVPADVLVRDPSVRGLIAENARIEKLADGFWFGEGPVWSREGHLLFSDPNTNVIYRWEPTGRVTVERVKSGYEGADVGRLNQPGSNGLAYDAQGRLTVCEHGNRRVTRVEPDGSVTVLADRFEGRRLNSPNDLVYRSDGALYFTDPPFGLAKVYDDPARELDFTGVFCLKDGVLRVVSKDLKGPNGIAFSPDERFLYVSNWDEKAKIVMRYEVRPDGSLAKGKEFFSMDGAPGEEALDGVKVDERGNLYASGPGGVWVISPAGRHLGTIRAPQLPANMAWGDADGRGLYMTARSGLYKLRLEVAGAPATGGSATRLHSEMKSR